MLVHAYTGCIAVFGISRNADISLSDGATEWLRAQVDIRKIVYSRLVPELGNASLYPWERHFTPTIPLWHLVTTRREGPIWLKIARYMFCIGVINRRNAGVVTDANDITPGTYKEDVSALKQTKKMYRKSIALL